MVRRETSAARSGCCSIVARKARTSAASSFHSTYSGGSKAGKRFTSLELLLELPEQTPARRLLGGQRFGELDGRRVTVVRVRLQGFGEGLLDGRGRVGAQLPDGSGLTAQPRDHHLLRIAALERQLPGEHLERHDAERVDVAARVERLAADLLGTHELGRAEDDTGGRELGDGRV